MQYQQSSSVSSLSYLRRKLGKVPVLSAAEERTLIITAQGGDQRARDRLVHAYLPLIVKSVRKFAGYKTADQDDLVSEALAGLLKAIERFDTALYSNRLVTLADQWIRARLGEYVLYASSPFKLGTTGWAKKLFFSLGREKSRLGIVDDNVSDEQCAIIAKRLGVEPEHVRETMLRMQPVCSLNAKLPTRGKHGSGETLEWIDVLVDTNAIGEDEIVADDEQEHQRAELQRRLAKLEPREREILLARFAGMTLEALSQKHSVSRERIRQVETRALERLRANADYKVSAEQRQARRRQHAALILEFCDKHPDLSVAALCKRLNSVGLRTLTNGEWTAVRLYEFQREWIRKVLDNSTGGRAAA